MLAGRDSRAKNGVAFAGWRPFPLIFLCDGLASGVGECGGRRRRGNAITSEECQSSNVSSTSSCELNHKQPKSEHLDSSLEQHPTCQLPASAPETNHGYSDMLTQPYEKENILSENPIDPR